MKIVYIHRKHFENPGDWWSTPHHFFEKGNVYDFFENPFEIEEQDCDLLIIGGGGILEIEHFSLFQIWINKFKPTKKIIWGAGAAKNTFNHKFYEQFDLIGLRNANSPFEFVPCVSCLHPLIKYNESGTGQVIIGHNRRPLPNQNHTQQVPMNLSINNINKAKKVITTSYHIYYWSRLMGKESELAIHKIYDNWKPVAEKYFTFAQDIELEHYKKIQFKFADKVYSK